MGWPSPSVGMGLTSFYTLSVSGKFDRFDDNIRLTPSQIEDANGKALNVCKTLHRLYYDGTAFDHVGIIVTGSYGKGTAIRPPRDIDIVFPLPWSQFQNYSGLAVQSRILQNVRDGLLRTFPQTDIKANGPVVLVPFQTFFVEVVPCFASPNVGRFFVCHTKSGGRWKDAAPLAEILNVQLADRFSNGNATRLIRMVKVWQQEFSVPIKSFYLELLAIEFLKIWKHNGGTSNPLYYALMIRDFFFYMLSQRNHSISAPGTGEVLMLGTQWAYKTVTAHLNASQACKIEEGNLEIFKNPGPFAAAITPARGKLATTAWQKIFGPSFVG